MCNQKAQEKTRVTLEFGILVQPFNELAEAGEPPSIAEYRIAIAKVQAGDGAWRRNVQEFTRFGEVHFQAEYQRLSHVPERFWMSIRKMIDTNQHEPQQFQEMYRQRYRQMHDEFVESVDAIPINWEACIFAANTPFSAYLRIRDAISSARQRIDYFDRYLKPDFIRLFLDGVPTTINVHLVTTQGNDRFGVTAIRPIVDLARQQFAVCQLIQVEPQIMHDRNLRVDDQVFTLGPGVDRAGVALTNFSPVGASREVNDRFDELIKQGNLVV